MNAIYYCYQENAFYWLLSNQNFTYTGVKLQVQSPQPFDQIIYKQLSTTSQLMFLGYYRTNIGGSSSFAGIIETNNFAMLRL